MNLIKIRHEKHRFKNRSKNLYSQNPLGIGPSHCPPKLYFETLRLVSTMPQKYENEIICLKKHFGRTHLFIAIFGSKFCTVFDVGRPGHRERAARGALGARQVEIGPETSGSCTDARQNHRGVKIKYFKVP